MDFHSEKSVPWFNIYTNFYILCTYGISATLGSYFILEHWKNRIIIDNFLFAGRDNEPTCI